MFGWGLFHQDINKTMIYQRLITLCIFCSCICLNKTSAQQSVPQEFSYQCAIRDTSGAVLSDRHVNLKFSIRKGGGNGNAVYIEEQLGLRTSKLGLLNVVIGTGNPLKGNFSEIDWGSDDFHLYVEVDLDDLGVYRNLGNQKLLSVPFALFAGSATNVVDTVNHLQMLELRNDSLSISRGNIVSLGKYLNSENTTDEIQFLDFKVSDKNNHEDSIFISNGNSVALPGVSFSVSDDNLNPATAFTYNNGNQEILIFYDDLINDQGEYDNSTGMFTAPISGTYFFSVSCQFAGSFSTSNDYVELSLRNFSTSKNIATTMQHFDHITINAAASGIVRLNAGDKVGAMVVNQGKNSITIETGDKSRNIFYGYRIGSL